MMGDPTSGDVLYAYGVVSGMGDAVGSAPRGIEEKAVEIVDTDGLGALVTTLPARDYSAVAVESSSGDVSWLGPRAEAHDRVLSWAQERGGVVPFPMFTMFGSRGALADSMRARSGELRTAFDHIAGADEYGLRLYRNDAEMTAAIDRIDPALAELRLASETAGPGQRYLMERKYADKARLAVRDASHRLAREVLARLTPAAREVVSRPLTPDGSAGGQATMVLNAAFLVPREGFADFRGKVSDAIAEYQPLGLRFDFTGPWPPYNFVGSRGDVALDG